MAKKRTKKQQRRETGSAPSAAKPVQSAEPRPAKPVRPAAKAPKLEALPPAPSPTSFFGYEVPWAKLLVFRFIVFGMLSVDALLQISHAPRYFAGGFNVANLPGMDSLGPGRVGFAVGELIASLLFAFIACGVATRIALPIATAIYGWLYFGSQLDSYQHHYLVWLVLLLCCFVRWEKPTGTPGAQPVRAWAVRLILIQLGILYFYAAISKCNPAWLDGRALDLQLQGTMRSAIDATVGIKAAAKLTVLLEFSLALCVWMRPAWWYALPAGVMFHIGIIASGLEIGLFAWLMLGFYLLVVPNAFYAVIANGVAVPSGLGDVGRDAVDRIAARTRRSRWELFRFSMAFFPLTIAVAAAASVFVLAMIVVVLVGAGITRALAIARSNAQRGAIADWLIASVGIVSGVMLATFTHFDMSLGVAIGATAACAGAIFATRDRALAARIGIALLVAFGIWFAVDRKTDTAIDYYRFWGGNARRLGDPDTSEKAYRRLTQIAPDDGNGHYQLGKLLVQRGQDKEALDELRLAQSLEPGKARSFTAEAELLSKQGNRAGAIKKAEEATYADPNDQSAQTLLRRLSGGGSAPAGDAQDDQ